MPKSKGEPLTRWVVSIPSDIAAEFDSINHNPVLERSRYGARSNFIVGCLKDFLSKHSRQDSERILQSFNEE